MANNGKYTQNKTVRLTKEQKDSLEQMRVSIREAIEYYIVNNTNELHQLKQRQKYLSNKFQ